MKWNLLDQLNSLKQEAKEIFKDFINKTKNLYNRHKASDKMSNEKLMDWFMNLLCNPTLQIFLKTTMRRTFAKACMVVMRFHISMNFK